MTRVFHDLVGHATRKEKHNRVKMVTSPQLNAYAISDGRVVFLTGLLEALPNVDLALIAYVAAHEILHVEYRHGEKKFQQSLTTGLLISILTCGACDWVRLLEGVSHRLITSGTLATRNMRQTGELSS